MLVTGYKLPNYSHLTSGIEGLSLGDMEKTWQDTTASEMRISLMDNLNKYQMGFNDIEQFDLGLLYNCKAIVDKDGAGGGKGRNVVRAAMEYKRHDEIKNRKNLIRRKIWMKRRAEDKLGGEKSNKYRKLIKHLNETANKTRQELRTKYEKKVEHLKRKYMDDKETELDRVPEEIEEFGGVVVFNKEKFENIKIDEIEIVKYGDVETSKDEEAVLRLHQRWQ